METGVPELDLPPIDPMSINQIGFTFWNVTAEFADTKLSGFKNFKMKYSKVDKQKRTWSIGISLPKINTVGTYQLYGSIPPNLDLGRSTGDERLEGKNVDLTIELKLDLDDIDLELECLFPKEGKCCPRKYLKSCNPGLARIVLKFINQKRNFVKNFQPGITTKMAEILRDYLNKALVNLDAKYVIEL